MVKWYRFERERKRKRKKKKRISQWIFMVARLNNIRREFMNVKCQLSDNDSNEFDGDMGIGPRPLPLGSGRIREKCSVGKYSEN